MSVRIIAGSAKGRTLRSFPGSDIRPTTDRIREAIFSIVYSRLGDLHGRVVLDLCSGTGAMAIEALSRGAERAVLVEKSAGAEKVARENLALCAFSERARQVRGQLPQALEQLPEGEKYAVIFLDPPYHGDLAGPTLALLADLDLLLPGGLVCVETGIKEQLRPSYGNLSMDSERRYGSTKVSFFSHAMTGER